MTQPVLKVAASVLVVGGLLASNASAAPVVNALALKSAAPSAIEDVQWRGWGWRGGWGYNRGWGWGAGGLVAGALIGAALASPYSYSYGDYYRPAYAYSPYSYAYAPYGYRYGYGYSPYYAYTPAYSYGYSPAYAYSPGYAYSYRPAYAAATDYGSSGRTVEWCKQRYRTYNESTGTFVGKGGRRIPCP